MFCREHVAQLRPHLPRIHAAGAELIVVGNGAPHFVRGFRETTGFEGPVFCDPDLSAYRAANLKRSLWRLLDPRGIGDAVRALARGARQTRVEGDAQQLGGAMVIRPPGTVVYRYASGRPGDLAPAAEVVAAVERAAAK
jgi:hypothetical protein